MDNQSAIAITKNPQFYDRTKHTEVRHHFIRDKIEQGEIELQYIPTGQQIANVMANALNREKHSEFAKEIGVHRPA